MAQYLTRVGIRTTVDAMTRSIYFPRRAKREFSFAMGGWSSRTAEATSFLQYWVTSFAPDARAWAPRNFHGRYGNPELDRVLRQALVTVNDAERDKLEQEAGAHDPGRPAQHPPALRKLDLGLPQGG